MIERIEPPYAGIDSQSAPSYITKGAAETSTNLLPGFRGKAPVRGGLVYSHRLPDPFPVPPYYVWTSAEGMLVRYGTAANYVLLDSDLADDADLGSSPFAPSVLTRPQFVNAGSYVYGLATQDSDDAPVLVRWNGLVTNPASGLVTYGSGTPNGASTSYEYRGVAHWLERLFLLKTSTGSGGERHAASGSSGGSASAVSSAVLHWTDTFDPASTLPTTPATWQDDVSGLTNTITLDGGSAPLKPVDLAKVGAHLAVLCEDRIIMVRGSAPSNWSVRTDVYVGAVSEAAHAEFADGLVFVARDGCYFYDGAQLVDLSENVKDIFEPGSYGRARVVMLDSEYALVVLLPAAEAGDPVWAGIVHVPTRAWTEFRVDADPMATSYPHTAVRSSWGPVVVGEDGTEQATRIWLADGLTRPGAAAGRDGYRAASEDFADPDTYVPIAATSMSRTVRLAQPLTKARVSRFVADYVQEGIAESGRGWAFVIKDPTELTNIHSEGTADTDDSASGSRHRHVAEVNAEVDEVKVQASFLGNTSTDLRGELQEVWIEHEPAQRGGSF